MRHLLIQEPLKSVIATHRLPDPVYVTLPRMPDLNRYHELLEGVWARRWLTNEGMIHQAFERRLAAYLGVEHLTLFCNGTTALLVALKLHGIEDGDVITTPFTFPATVHALHWQGLTPVFGDIEADTLGLAPGGVEALITPRTRAILPVHVFGIPCAVDDIEAIAAKHGLPVIYDAAHAFGVQRAGRPIIERGATSMLSFHATKLFTSIEGGALVHSNAAEKRAAYLLKNFGIAGEDEIVGPGINGKMNEFQAAFGLLGLDTVNDEIVARQALAALYRATLSDIPGLELPQSGNDVVENGSYLPILIDAEVFGMSRDSLHAVLRAANIVSRRYFYPLVSHIPPYDALPTATPANLPIAERTAGSILCLPLYGELPSKTVERICSCIRAVHQGVSQ